MNRLAKVSLIFTAMIVALAIGGVVYADAPPVQEEELSVEDWQVQGALQPPPLPTIPTADEYVPPPDPSKRIQTPLEDTDNATSSSRPCYPWNDLELTYETRSVPDGGTAEGFAGFYYGQYWNCKLWIQPVAGSRITYGGEVDFGRVWGRAYELWPTYSETFNARSSRAPCNMRCARVIDPDPEDFDVTFPKRRWAANGEHYFSDGDGKEFWYVVFNTRHVMEY